MLYIFFNTFYKHTIINILLYTKKWKVQKKILKHRNSLDSTFTKFKMDVDNIIDDTKHIIID